MWIIGRLQGALGLGILIAFFTPLFCVIIEMGEIRDMWQFKSHATKTALLSIDNQKVISGTGPQGKGSYSYTQGDYVFATAKGVEITVKSQTVPNDLMKRYVADQPIILYYDNDSPQTIRFDGQTLSLFWVVAGLIFYAGIFVMLVKKPEGKR